MDNSEGINKTIEKENNSEETSIKDKIERKKYLIKKLVLVLDIIIVLALAAMLIYFLKEKAIFDMLKGDACKICEFKTHAQCIVMELP